MDNENQITPGYSPREIRRPTFAEIDLGALKRNYEYLRSRIPKSVKIMGVVKADAYHHDAVMVSRTLEKCGIDYLAVALVEEGMHLRDAGVTAPVMLLSGAYGLDPWRLVESKLQPVVYDLETIADLDAKAELPIPVHVKIDSGMGRLGFLPRQIPLLLQVLKSCEKIRVAGLLTHLSSADEEDETYTKEQLEIFKAAVDAFRKAGISPSLVHAANSAGALFHEDDAYFNMVRLGLSLYGVSPTQESSSRYELSPVMSLKTSIIQIQVFPPGASVSYGRTFTTKRESRIATIPLGYADGFSRRLSNCGSVLVRGRRVPVVGRVCMDLTMLDVTDLPDAKVGDEVVALGKQNGEIISAYEIAEKIGTIPYETLTSVSIRVPRVYKY